jgi:pseudouridine-5'-monophosphatase
VPLPGAVAAVHAFAGRIPVAIATSSTRSYLELKRRNNEALFAGIDAVICGDDAAVKGKGKPDPAIFLEAARVLGVPPAACAAFEDATAGVCSAKAAGMFVVGIPDPRLDIAEFMAAGPDVVLRSLAEFDAAVVGIGLPAAAAGSGGVGVGSVGEAGGRAPPAGNEGRGSSGAAAAH